MIFTFRNRINVLISYLKYKNVNFLINMLFPYYEVYLNISDLKYFNEIEITFFSNYKMKFFRN